MKPLAKWKQEYLEQVRAYPNAELLVQAFALAGGDDYDGCFTDRGQWLFDAMSYELDTRLWLAEWSEMAPFSVWGKEEP